MGLKMIFRKLAINNKVYKTTMVVKHRSYLSPSTGKQYVTLFFKIFTHLGSPTVTQPSF